jgi:hypothetical protein
MATGAITQGEGRQEGEKEQVKICKGTGEQEYSQNLMFF